MRKRLGCCIALPHPPQNHPNCAPHPHLIRKALPQLWQHRQRQQQQRAQEAAEAPYKGKLSLLHAKQRAPPVPESSAGNPFLPREKAIVGAAGAAAPLAARRWRPSDGLAAASRPA